MSNSRKKPTGRRDVPGPGKKFIFRPYITLKDGRRIRRANGRMFRLEVDA